MRTLLDEIPPKPLLRLSPLQPGESLPSLLERLTLLNFYDSPLILQRLSRAEWPDRPGCPSQASTFQRLAALTCIAAFDLFAASDHAIAASEDVSNLIDWQPPDLTKGIPFWGLPPVNGSMHPSQASCFCPQCLKESPYHRLAWRPAAMAVCLVHNCLLADTCPTCNSLTSIRDIVLRRCAHCQFDLSQVATPSIQNETWGRASQEILWSWLTGQPAINYNLGWPDAPLPVLCNLAEGLASAMVIFPERFPPHPFHPASRLETIKTRKTLCHFSPPAIFWAYTSALKWMINWPEGCREFLQLCAPKPVPTLKRALGNFYVSWISKRWNNAKFIFFHETLHTFRSDRFSFVSEQPKQYLPFERIFAYANLREAAHILQTPENMVRRLGQLGMIHEVGLSSTAFYLRSDLRSVKHDWNELLSLKEAAKWLGLASEIVLALTKENILRVVPGLEEGERTIFFTRKAVARLLDRVNSRIGDLDYQKGLISLAEAARQLDCIRINEARLLKRILADSLHAWRSPRKRDDWRMEAISFTQQDIDEILKEAALSKGWLSADEVSANLGVEEDIFLGWIERDLLKPVIVYNGEPYLKPSEIEKFLAEYIFDPEALELLDMSWRRFLGYIRRGGLKPVAGPDLDDCPRYLLLRKKVEQLARRLQKRKSLVCLNISETQSHYI